MFLAGNQHVELAPNISVQHNDTGTPWVQEADRHAMTVRPANPDTVTPVRLAIQTCEKTCKKFASNVSRHDNAD